MLSSCQRVEAGRHHFIDDAVDENPRGGKVTGRSEVDDPVSNGAGDIVRGHAAVAQILDILADRVLKHRE